MRGVISAGMVSALESLGMIDAFDAVYGSSAGAINAAYFLAGQASLGSTIYFQDINNSRFIDLSRAFLGRPIVNLEYLFGDVMRRRKILDVDRVLASGAPLTVIATDVDTRMSQPLDRFATADQLMGGLRASATMPVIAGHPHEFGGRRYLDASISEPVPVPTAERRGHTHVLALLTRGRGMRPQASAFDRYFVGPRLRRMSAELATLYLARGGPYSELARHIDAGAGPLGQAQVLGVRVTDLHISKLERRREVLEAGAARGRDAILALFRRSSG